MNEKEQIEKSHKLASEWFLIHVAKFIGANRLSELEPVVIEWRRPETSNYAMRYIITGNYVIVTGDVGEAIYGFGQNLTLEMLTKFDWHYFINKCCASETGRNYTMKIPGIKSPVPNCRAIAHFVGLQMAIKQLSSGQ